MGDDRTDRSEFIFEYECITGYGWPVKVVVDAPLDSEKDLKHFKCFPNSQKREFAHHLLSKYETEKYHDLSDQDFNNPFAQKVARSFKHGVQIYWMKRPRDTILIFTESDPTS